MSKSNRSMNVSGGNGVSRGKPAPYDALSPAPGLTGTGVRVGRNSNRNPTAGGVKDGATMRAQSGFTQGGAFDPRGRT